VPGGTAVVTTLDEPISMSESPEVFQQLADCRTAAGPVATVDQLITYLEQQHRYHELFEALKMRVRLDLGISAAQIDREERLGEEVELKLERGLIDACRRVGEGLLKQGRVREGWMYLRPVGDRQAAARLLSAIEPNDENTDPLLEVLVHEGVDVGAGYALALRRLGTCNCITLFETAIAGRPRRDQQVAAGLLVEHVHRELLQNLRRDIAQRESQEPTGETAAELLASRTSLLRDGSYHLDTTHLASTIRFARVLDDPRQLRLALDLTSYGRHLHPQFQYPGEEPFLDLYPASAAFFRALLGEQVDAGVRYFAQKADAVDREQYGNIAIEVLIDLLSRCGRHAEALKEYARRLPVDARLMGIAPTLLELAYRMGDYTAMKEVCLQRDDLLGYAVALLHE
jgi:hypothetical protein